MRSARCTRNAGREASVRKMRESTPGGASCAHRLGRPAAACGKRPPCSERAPRSCVRPRLESRCARSCAGPALSASAPSSRPARSPWAPGGRRDPPSGRFRHAVRAACGGGLSARPPARPSRRRACGIPLGGARDPCEIAPSGARSLSEAPAPGRFSAREWTQPAGCRPPRNSGSSARQIPAAARAGRPLGGSGAARRWRGRPAAMQPLACPPCTLPKYPYSLGPALPRSACKTWTPPDAPFTARV